MRTAAIILAAPIGYLFLTGYLLAKIQPLPISFVPERSTDSPAIDTPIAA